MKKYIGFLIILICLTSTLFYEAMAINQGDGKGKGSQTKYLPKVGDSNPVSSILDINNITSWFTADGYWPSVWGGDGWNGSYPKGQPTGVDFQEGIVWGGLVNDGGTPTLRVGGNTYFAGTTRLQRLFRVRPDWQTADLTDDAANFFLVSNSQVTAGQIAQIKAQYQLDWDQWPASSGAPYEDVNHDGVYEPDVDIPGIPGASQTLFAKFNDASSVSAYGSPPIGLVVNETIWGYAIANPLNNITFRKADVIYTGTANASTNAEIDSMYLVQWCDFDIGNAGDDFAGCDTTLGLGYCYNATAHDAYFDAIGTAPPAAGFDFFQGVSHYTGNPADSAVFNLKYRHGWKYTNLNSQKNPMTTFVYFAAGGAWSDPAGQSYTGSEEWYSLMRGYQPQPWPTKLPFPTNVQGVTVSGDGTYLLPGDPVTHTGWVDGEVEGAGDRRVCLETGPFTMHRGDTVEVVTALIAGTGLDNLSSVSVLKFYDNFAQYAYDQLFNLPNIPSPQVTVTAINGGVFLNWDNQQNVSKIESADHKGYNFEGYNVYQLPSATNDLSQAKRIATYDVVDGISTIEDAQFDQSTGAIIVKPVQFGGDNGVKRYITITNDALRGNVPMVNGTNYYFCVTAYGYNPDPTVPFHALESSPVPLNVVPQVPNPGVTIPAKPGGLTVTHNGSGNGSVVATVVDVDSTNGHQYKVGTFVQTYYNDASGNWHLLNNVVHKNKTSIKIAPNGAKDVSPSTMSYVAQYGIVGGTLDITGALNLISPDYDYVDGIKVTVPAGVTIHSANIIDNCANGDVDTGKVDNTAHTITWGANDTTGFGCFSGSSAQLLKFNVSATLPFTVNYLVWDDGYGYVYQTDTLGVGSVINATGSATIDSATAALVNQYQWFLLDSTSNTVLLDHQTIFGGVDIYAGTPVGGSSTGSGLGANVGLNGQRLANGLLVNVKANFSAPLQLGNVLLNGKQLSADATRGGPNVQYTNANWHVSDFTSFSGFADATVNSTLGSYAAGAHGTTDLTQLADDYEFRWTGVMADTTIGAITIKYVQSGGQMITCFGASGYSIANHPLNPNPGSTAPFALRAPFEVWNIDSNEQVNLLYWDRLGNPTVTGGSSWLETNRQYVWTVNTPYQPTALSPTSPDVAAHGTWNTVFWLSQYTVGDVITTVYPNPVVPGVDNWTFTSPNSPSYNGSQAVTDVNQINVFPNPYYGFNSRELNRSQKYVTFSHLPPQATLRIFDLAGHQVAVINKNDPTQFTNWNLLNDHSYPVASGVYVVYIDMPGLGVTKILKLAVVQEQQILNTY